MRGRLVTVLMLVVLALALVPTALLAALSDLEKSSLVSVVGAQLLGFALLARAGLLSRRPHHHQERWDSRTRRWRGASAAAVAAAAAVVVVGLFLQLEALSAGALGVLLSAATGLTVGVLDRYARRVALEDPPDLVKPADGDRLEPAHLRATIHRRLLRITALGVGLATVGTVSTVLLGAGPVGVVFAGLASIPVSGLVLSFSLMSLQFAAGRQLSAFVSARPEGDLTPVRRAVLKGRATQLDPDRRGLAVEWARAAEPSMLLQALGQGGLMLSIASGQALRLLDGPRHPAAVAFVAAMALLAMLLTPLLMLQHRRVRAVAQS